MEHHVGLSLSCNLQHFAVFVTSAWLPRLPLCFVEWTIPSSMYPGTMRWPIVHGQKNVCQLKLSGSMHAGQAKLTGTEWSAYVPQM